MALALVDLDSPSVVEDVRRACEEIGFLVLTGHGVDRKLVAEIDSLARAFFDLPTEEKLRFQDGDLAPDRPVYRPMRSESLGATSGDARHRDLKESLDYGPTLPGSGWPEKPPGLERVLRAYLSAMNELGAVSVASSHVRSTATPTTSSRCSTTARRAFESSTTRRSMRARRPASCAQARIVTMGS